MKRVPLLTSIPPRFARRDGSGVDVGPAYAAQCVRSWRECGFEPHTVNAAAEESAGLIGSEAIRRLDVARDARPLCGKPLVWLDDLLRAARSVSDGPVAITNADILLEPAAEAARLVAALRPGQCVVAKRVDVPTLGARDGQAYPEGYDFFAFHVEDLRGLGESPFVFGLPWWDQYLPIALLLRGVRPVPLPGPFAYHLLHQERWDWELWARLGRQYLELFDRRPGDGTADYARRIRRAAAGVDRPVAARVRTALRRLTAAGRKREEVRALYRVSLSNEEWLGSRLRS